MSSDRGEELKRIIDSAQKEANQRVADSGLVERRRKALHENSDYQRRKRLGHDGRAREAVEILAKNIHERNHHGEAIPSYDQARREAGEKAERLERKQNER